MLRWLARLLALSTKLPCYDDWRGGPGRSCVCSEAYEKGPQVQLYQP